MSVAIFRQLSAAHAAQAAAFRQAADELEAAGVKAASDAAPAPAAEVKPKGKPGPKPKAAPVVAEEVVQDDPLAGLTAGEDTSETTASESPAAEDDPLAALMGVGEPEAPAAPVVTKEELAKLLNEFAVLVDGVRGKGAGGTALKALFEKHGAANLKELKEDEYLGVKNEATAVIEAVKKMKQ